jgi:hypothetical protein
MRRFLPVSWQGLLLSAVGAAAFLHLGYWILAAEIIERPLDPACAAMDRETSIGIALLVPHAEALIEARLDDALYRLRRARKNCRAGWHELARSDYDALRDAYPFPQRASDAASGVGR